MATFTPQNVSWTSSSNDFVYLFDWDTIVVDGSKNNNLSMRIQLCTGLFPCALNMVGINNGSIKRVDAGSISCWSTNGCTNVVVETVDLWCEDVDAAVPIFKVFQSSLSISSSSFSSCTSTIDGGIVQSYNGALVTINHSKFENLHSFGYGGALIAIGSQVAVINSIFSNCSSDKGGGAISASTYQLTGSEHSVETDVSISLSSFYDCSSSALGGAIIAFSQPSQLNPLIRIFISSAKFIKCWSYSGGAVYASGQTVFTQIQNCSFLMCKASSSGGALSLNDLAAVKSLSSSFMHNSANGLGGGAIFVKSSYFNSFASSFNYNNAPLGGGGSLLWQGNIPPSLQQSDLCELNNTAMYGQCIASDLKVLAIVSSARDGGIVFPGLPFDMLVVKMDAYNQTISTDSSSLVEIVPVLDKSLNSDPSVAIQGETIVQMHDGVGNFSVSIEPSFSVGPSGNEVVRVNHLPLIYFTGDDSQALVQSTMRSSLIQLPIGNGSHVCPRGYVLSLQKSSSSSIGLSGTCELCGPGTYSLDPLKGINENDPSCLTCPIGANCRGGNDVDFVMGEWTESEGIYLLVGCPLGYQLVNYAQMGIFSQERQQCKSCSHDQYIIDSHNSSFFCQPCPMGAICNGSSMIGRVNGSVWIIDWSVGQYVLEACPAGYELQNKGTTGQFSYSAQQCQLCSAGRYCLGGITSAISCPDTFFAPPGAKSLSNCEPAIFVDVIVVMPILEEDFSNIVQEAFLQALATTLNISAGEVIISGISQLRRSADSSIEITSKLAASDQGQASIWVQRFDITNLNIELAKRGVASCTLQSISVVSLQANVQSGLNVIGVSIGTAAAAVAVLVIVVAFIFSLRQKSVSRRLIGAAVGAQANQSDLPYELRDKYEALHVLGCGAFGVVLEVVLLHSRTRTHIHRAIKLVHCSQKTFTVQELRRLDREVSMICRIFSILQFHLMYS